MKQNFFNLKLDVTTASGVLSVCRHYFSSKGTRCLFFLNAHCFNVAQKNITYRDVLNHCDLLLNDGIGIKLASRLRGIRLKENLNGTDLIPMIINLAEELQISVFLLGGKEHVPERAAWMLRSSNLNLQIAGWHSGYFSTDENVEILRRINDSGAGLLILGMGVPRQEIWASGNKDKLRNVKLIIGGGAILDFISGEVRRAPVWLRKISMEWAYRLYLEPRRLWKRYIIGNNVFFFHVFRLMLN